MEPRPAPSRVLEHSGPRTAAGSTSGPAPEGVASPPPRPSPCSGRLWARAAAGSTSGPAPEGVGPPAPAPCSGTFWARPPQGAPPVPPRVSSSAWYSCTFSLWCCSSRHSLSSSSLENFPEVFAWKGSASGERPGVRDHPSQQARCSAFTHVTAGQSRSPDLTASRADGGETTQ